ncbi:hypothetical protein HORIV_33180 [Vreelandella olivaria]|uniref:Uncharacterized protein n=1 Tax=Vreelandella olivaria TaxID=390919 RepID=A0ABM7GK88_9GAMM|nr:hypothetical protein HORIV_33180 [Halomonas olivaria]
MLERAADFNAVPLACGVAALLEERESAERSLHDALALRLRQPQRFPIWQREALRLSKRAGVALSDAKLAPLGSLLALAYPERVGQLIEPGKFRLANGKTATLPLNDALAHQSYLVAVALSSQTGGEARITAGEPLSLESLLCSTPVFSNGSRGQRGRKKGGV